MIHPARHGCVRTLCATVILPTTTIPPCHIPLAESSHQAARRASLIQRHVRNITTSWRKGKAPGRVYGRCEIHREYGGYSTAAVVVKETEGGIKELRPPDTDWRSKDDDIEADLGGIDGRPSGHRPIHPQCSERPKISPTHPMKCDFDSLPSPLEHSISGSPPEPVDNLRPFPSTHPPDRETWRRRFLHLAESDPLVCFLSIHSLNTDAMSCIAAEDFDQLYQAVKRARIDNPNLATSVKMETAKTNLTRLRRHLEDLPPQTPAKEGYKPGPRLRGRRLDNFLRLCIWFKCFDLAKNVFVAHFPLQIADGLCNVRQLEIFLGYLAYERHWRLAINLFAHQSFPAQQPNFPINLWTPYILSTIMRAFLLVREPFAVPPLVKLYRGAGLTMDMSCYHQLLQAHVALGEVDQARNIRLEAKSHGFEPEAHQFGEKNALLKGQRGMGSDRVFERLVLDEIESNRLQNPPPSAAQFSAETLHNVVRLRLDTGDIQGAKRLIRHFDLPMKDHSNTNSQRIRPTALTMILAFETICRQPEEQSLATWWSYMSSQPILLQDRVIAVLVNALVTLRRTDLAFRMIEAHVSPHLDTTDSEPLTWSLPENASVGNRTFDALLAGMARHEGIPGLQRAADLMRDAGVSTDSRTLEIILHAVRSNMSTNPQGLAELLIAMLKRAKDVNATIGHIDEIMAEAVQSAAQTYPHPGPHLAPFADDDLTGPTAGLKPIGTFAKVIEVILKSLRARGVRAQGNSIANRLRFEAMSGSQFPSARFVWNQLIDKGFQPNERHLISIMRGYADAGKMDEAEAVIGLAQQTGSLVTRGMLMVLVVGWGRLGRLIQARAAYENIRKLGYDNPGSGLDPPAVSAMIKTYYDARKLRSAANITRDDLLKFSEQLGEREYVTGITALRWIDDDVGAIKLLEANNSSGQLSDFTRKIVRTIRVHVHRKRYQGRATVAELALIPRIDDILHKDWKMRLEPHVTEHDKKPRGRLCWKPSKPLPLLESIRVVANMTASHLSPDDQEQALQGDALPPKKVKTSEEILAIRAKRRRGRQKRYEAKEPVRLAQAVRAQLAQEVRDGIKREMDERRALARATEEWSKGVMRTDLGGHSHTNPTSAPNSNKPTTQADSRGGTRGEK